MPDFTTSYVFVLDVEGAQAVAKAQQFRQQIQQALAGATTGGTVTLDPAQFQALNTNLVQIVGNVQDIAEASDQMAERMERGMQRAGRAAQNAGQQVRTGFWGIIDRANQATNQATLQYFGMRRLGYGLAYLGTSMSMFGQSIEDAMTRARESYLELAEATRGAGIVLGMDPQQVEELQNRVMDIASTYGYFSAADT
ncbi:MAG: hypothetical protein PHV11_07435, partial [Candidatus Bipolaricaulis sp.]|nr:hypothetical protein [Candidatus Bipolaricaulis sp.]